MNESPTAVDAASVYDPHPTLTYGWDPETAPSMSRAQSQSPTNAGQSFDLGPHPADPLSMVQPTVYVDNHESPTEIKQRVPGQEIWVYVGSGGCVAWCISLCTCADARAQDLYVLAVHDTCSIGPRRDARQVQHQ